MSFLESAKQYTGSDLETIFFRPILSGDSARELGVRVLYNMPVPTTIQLWDGQRNVLQKYSAAGWTGGNAATKLQKDHQPGTREGRTGIFGRRLFLAGL
jgi:hypothetical protein